MHEKRVTGRGGSGIQGGYRQIEGYGGDGHMNNGAYRGRGPGGGGRGDNRGGYRGGRGGGYGFGGYGGFCDSRSKMAIVEEGKTSQLQSNYFRFNSRTENRMIYIYKVEYSNLNERQLKNRAL